MKVLLFTLEFPPLNGGAGTVAKNFLKGFCQSEVEFDLEVLTIKTEVENINKVRFLNQKYKIDHWYIWAPFVLMYHLLIRREKPDVVIIWDYYSFLVMPLWLFKILNLRTIYVIHGPELEYLVNQKKMRDKLYGLFNSFTRKLSFFNRIVLVSDPYLTRAKHMFPLLENKMKLIANGVNVEIGTNKPNRILVKKTRYVIVGRLVSLKRIDFVIRAFIKSELSQNGCELFIVGDGPCRLELVNLAKADMGISFVGSKSSEEVHEIIKDCDFLVSFSDKSESFGLTILEAASVGVPSITSLVFKDNGVVLDQITGLVVEDDSIDSLTNVLLYSHMNKFKIWHNLSDSAREFVIQNFSHSRMFNSYLSIIHE